MVADLAASAQRFSPTDCPRLIVKIGSALLVDGDGQVRRDWLTGVVADIAGRHRAGQKIAVVSSGAIALGARRLGLPHHTSSSAILIQTLLLPLGYLHA